MNEFLAERMGTIRWEMEQTGLRGMILNQPAHIYHLTGWLPPDWVTAFFVAGINSTVLVTSLAPPDLQPVWDDMFLFDTFSLDTQIDTIENTVAALMQAVGQAGLLGQPTGAVLEAFPAACALPLVAARVVLRDASDMMAKLMMIKDRAAQREIRRRVTMLDRGFEAALSAIVEGVSELEVFTTIYGALAAELDAPFTLNCVLASGQRALLDEPQPTNKRLEQGDTVLIDLFPNLGGYAADYTRTFVVGQPTPDQCAQHAVLEHALDRAEEVLRPGVLASEVDRAVREVIEESDFAAHAYQHHSGHGFGLLAAESPWLIPAEHTPLCSGMVIAVEPGIYHPVVGGMRLEGNYLITEDGFEMLDGFTRALTGCS